MLYVRYLWEKYSFKSLTYWNVELQGSLFSPKEAQQRMKN